MIQQIDDNPITIQRGLLSDKELLAAELAPLGSRFAVITQDPLLSLYAEPFAQRLRLAGLDVELLSFPVGEAYKTHATKEALENQLFAHAFGKDSCLIALGGGVVTDLVGYLAATYCRGVSLVLIPTSLLAMIDASIGGKTGINTPFGKNLIGCFYPAQKIFIDPTTLCTLPARELRNGIVEMIKHALIADASLFSYLETHVEAILSLEPIVIDFILEKNCRIKTSIVKQDRQEHGYRHQLNLGHTFGHALEHLSHYTLSHGEAVALGLLIEAHLCNHLKTEEKARIFSLLKRAGLPLEIPPLISIEALLKSMTLDKKARHQTPRFVLLKKIGATLECQGSFCSQLPETQIFNAFNEIRHALRCD